MTHLTIDRLGHLGDGIAGDAFVPFTLPGEVVETGPPLRILHPSPERQTPPCPQFGQCGGCALQHGSDAFLKGWKEDVIRRALAGRGLTAPFRPAAISPPHSRRRATLAGRRGKKAVQIGFHTRASDRIVPLTGCILLSPALLAMIPPLETLVRIGGSRKGALRLGLTETLDGCDVHVTGGKALDRELRAALAGWAGTAGVARLTWEDEQIAQHAPPRHQIGPAQVVLPAGAFLQATAEGEAALQSAVAGAVGPEARHIIDLFAGCGTFALPLATQGDVLAVESAAPMLAALDAGWRGAVGLREITTQTRDLFRRPLLPDELSRADAVVIDPPRAGAEAQSAELARSSVPRIAAVSCNPVTFARDAQILVEGGYRLEWVQMIDQFRWSAHVELVAAFSRTGDPQAR